MESYKGKSGNNQQRALLHAPSSETLKGKRDLAILSVFLYDGLRPGELCSLKVRDIQQRRGVPHLRVHGRALQYDDLILLNKPWADKLLLKNNATAHKMILIR